MAASKDKHLSLPSSAKDEDRTLLAELVNSSPQGLLIADQRQRLVYANPAAGRLLQCPAEELIGSKLGFLVTPGPPVDMFLADENGTDQLVVRQVLLQEWGGEPHFFIYLYLNTDYAQTNNALLQKLKQCQAELSITNAKLHRSASLRDNFLASMSHELRTPLNAILGITEALNEAVYGEFNPKQKHALALIEESSYHLLSLINSMLDLSKISAGKLNLDLQAVNVEEVCQAALRQVQDMAQKKQLKLSLLLDSRIRTTLADPQRLKQILVHLLTNAVKFTPEQGRIGLEVEADEVQDWVRLCVWDTGIGIPEDEIEQLIEPFIQRENALTRQYGGVGLGLSLAYRLIELHGGSLQVSSKPDQGSRFSVLLPWEDKAQESIPASREISQTLSSNGEEEARCSVLVVEDNEDNLRAIGDYLRAYHYQVIEARNGLEAVQVYQDLHPEFIIMDIQMPKLDGLEATRRIRQLDEAGSKVPIIAVTALAMDGDRERCLAAGANKYLSKPISFKRLAEMLSQFTHCIENIPEQD